MSQVPPSIDSSQTEESSSGKGGFALKLVLILAALAALIYLGRQGGGAIEAFARWVESLGVWGPIVFILGYAVAAVAFLPGSLLTLAAGAIFGLAWGTVYAFLGASLGAAAAFLVARYVARRAIERKLEERPKFQAIDRAVGREGGKIVALLRLAPVIPFNLLNYGLGLTKIPFLPYALASFAMIPGTLLYVYYGTVLGDLASLAGGGTQAERGAAEWALLIVGLLATLGVTILITKKAKQAIQEEVGDV